MADIPTYPLYNRTYLLYRLSPLHHGDTPLLHEPALRAHAKSLKERLKGDNVRGVQVDFAAAADALPKLGPLDECSWDLIGSEDAWIEQLRPLVDMDVSELTVPPLAAKDARGVQVTLEYDHMSYNALLLRDPESTESPESFTSLPLLLVKMPIAIRDIFLDYLRTTFDAHVVPLRLSSAFVTSSLESYFRHLAAGQSGDGSAQAIQEGMRRVDLQLSFPRATTLLRHMDISIAERDVPGFVHRGQGPGRERPFTTALATYVRKHLAVDLSHPKVHITRITCRSFVLGTDRLKLSAPDIAVDPNDSDAEVTSASQKAANELYKSLVREATGTGKFLSEDLTADLSTPSSTASVGAGRRKRAVSNTAPGNANTKKSRARGKENGTRAGNDDMAEI